LNIIRADIVAQFQQHSSQPPQFNFLTNNPLTAAPDALHVL
jgi:hypothetical protein